MLAAIGHVWQGITRKTHIFICFLKDLHDCLSNQTVRDKMRSSYYPCKGRLLLNPLDRLSLHPAKTFSWTKGHKEKRLEFGPPRET